MGFITISGESSQAAAMGDEEVQPSRITETNGNISARKLNLQRLKLWYRVYLREMRIPQDPIQYIPFILTTFLIPVPVILPMDSLKDSSIA